VEAGREVLNAAKTTIKVARGMIGYLRRPDQRVSWGGAFNGQQHRLAIFHELLNLFRFRTIVETGTHRGTTTEFFASIPRIHVYTIESHPWSYGYCRTRFFFDARVTVLWGDSRERLCQLTKDGNVARPVFFYLDAHWYNDSPLMTELDIIFSECRDAIVMIDDFKVEGDKYYQFDDYGGMKRLCIEYIKPVVEKFEPSLFFPSANGELENGARRGCIVLVARDFSAQTNSLSTLRRYSLRR